MGCRKECRILAWVNLTRGPRQGLNGVQKGMQDPCLGQSHTGTEENVPCWLVVAFLKFGRGRIFTHSPRGAVATFGLLKTAWTAERTGWGSSRNGKPPKKPCTVRICKRARKQHGSRIPGRGLGAITQDSSGLRNVLPMMPRPFSLRSGRSVGQVGVTCKFPPPAPMPKH